MEWQIPTFEDLKKGISTEIVGKIPKKSVSSGRGTNMKKRLLSIS